MLVVPSRQPFKLLCRADGHGTKGFPLRQLSRQGLPNRKSIHFLIRVMGLRLCFVPSQNYSSDTQYISRLTVLGTVSLLLYPCLVGPTERQCATLYKRQYMCSLFWVPEPWNGC